MNIEKIARESIDFINSKYKLPSDGFVAGGSIANLIWEKVSGTPAKINDIDIYIFYKEAPYNSNDVSKKQHFTDKEIYTYDDYRGLNYTYRTKDYYSINKSERNGIINNIYYESTNPCPSTILKSFDINCCQIGYDIKSDKFYWTSDFEDFIKNGKLKITNLSTPSHTAIRIVKKRDELKADFDEIELDMAEYCIGYKRFLDSCKSKFKDRYADIYRKYQSELSLRFKLERDIDTEAWISQQYGVDDRIWQLTPNEPVEITNNNDINFVVNSITRLFPNLNQIHLPKSTDFIYYVRNIFGNKELEKIWKDINLLFNSDGSIENYLDQKVSNEDLKLLHNLCNSSPRSLNQLRGMKISEQLDILKFLIKTYSDDPIVAITILENHSVEEIKKQDEFGLMLLELSHRRDIIFDNNNRVDKLFDGIKIESII